MSSINQTGTGIRLPNFCNLGVMLRALLVSNAVVLVAAVTLARSPGDVVAQLIALAAFAEPVLLVSLPLFCAARRLLHALPYPTAVALVLGVELVLTLGWLALLGEAYAEAARPAAWKAAALCLAATAATLLYFDLRARAQSPAVAEARIQALQARIRPHFFFNSLNTVISLIRAQPRVAERALEDLADLFRGLMAGTQTLNALAREIDFVRQYLAIEALRLGDRLQVAWESDGMPGEALVPSMLLQPLVENAVYHGIQPLEKGGEIRITARAEGEELLIQLTNPYTAQGDRHAGNRMALDNIRERLRLHYDAEASLETRSEGGLYTVTIRLPLVREARP